ARGSSGRSSPRSRTRPPRPPPSPGPARAARPARSSACSRSRSRRSAGRLVVVGTRGGGVVGGCLRVGPVLGVVRPVALQRLVQLALELVVGPRSVPVAVPLHLRSSVRDPL